MPKRIAPIPASTNSPIMRATGSYDPNFYAYLKSLEAVVAELQKNLETNRVAVNETRASPATVFPPVAPF
jgi:hypothetical protein